MLGIAVSAQTLLSVPGKGGFHESRIRYYVGPMCLVSVEYVRSTMEIRRSHLRDLFIVLPFIAYSCVVKKNADTR